MRGLGGGGAWVPIPDSNGCGSLITDTIKRDETITAELRVSLCKTDRIQKHQIEKHDWSFLSFKRLSC